MYALNHTEHSGMQYELLACIVIPSNPGTFISILNFRIAKALLPRRCVYLSTCAPSPLGYCGLGAGSIPFRVIVNIFIRALSDSNKDSAFYLKKYTRHN